MLHPPHTPLTLRFNYPPVQAPYTPYPLPHCGSVMVGAGSVCRVIWDLVSIFRAFSSQKAFTNSISADFPTLRGGGDGGGGAGVEWGEWYF